MKKFRKLSSVLMAILFLFAMVTPAGSVGMDLDETIHTGGMNDLNVRQAARDYMDTRAAYLLGETETMEWLVTGITDDEAAHLDIYREAGITVIESEYDIVTVECYDNESYATVNETVIYTINGVAGMEQIVHEMTVMCSSNSMCVISDRYAESFSGFESCSYVSPLPEDSMSAMANQGGSNSCVVYIALKEVGTPETGDNLTKYGEWYGNNGNDWCATFLSWCAYTANIDVSIIAKNADCDGQMNFFLNRNRFYFAPRYGSTYTPRAGDVIVFGVYEDTEKDANHVGIVEKVENGRVYTIEGNASNRVRSKNYALDDTKIIGYGNPDYESTGHTYSQYYYADDVHILGCANCGHLMSPSNTAPHFYYVNYDEANHWEECIGCGHQKM